MSEPVEPVEFLTPDDLVDLARRLLGDPPPIRDAGLLASAAARPQATVFGEDAYPEVGEKAAALLHSIVTNHPLVDGNKRLGWLAAAVFLLLNGVAADEAGNDDVYDLVIAVAEGRPRFRESGEIAAGLRAVVTTIGERGPAGAHA